MLIYRVTITDRFETARHTFIIYYFLINYHFLVSVIYRKNKYQQLIKVEKRQLRHPSTPLRTIGDGAKHGRAVASPPLGGGGRLGVKKILPEAGRILY